MVNWKDILISPSLPIVNAIELIDTTALQIALVVDKNNRLVGTVTDGDIRRGILRNISLEEPVQRIMNPRPTFAKVHDSREIITAIMKLKKLQHIPVVDDDGCIINLESWTDIFQSYNYDNWVVLMAGGQGSRLRPLTEECPKPMLKVGTKPILETILGNFIAYGFHRFYISVNYKAEMIESYFGDGSNWGVEIRYIHEEQAMGTAGSLSLLPEKASKSIVVMNGDLLTKVNFQQLLDFHREHQAQGTMCVREYDFQVPYGVAKMEKHHITRIDEKPMQRFFVNAGIYVLEPEVLELIPKDTSFDMPDLFNKLIQYNCETAGFPIREYWIDIGRMTDFERANGEFTKMFSPGDD